MKEEDGRSEYTDMEPGALLSGEIEHRAALFTLAKDRRRPSRLKPASHEGLHEEVEAALERAARTVQGVRSTRSAVRFRAVKTRWSDKLWF